MNTLDMVALGLFVMVVALALWELLDDVRFKRAVRRRLDKYLGE